jgi:hypothetical protein
LHKKAKNERLTAVSGSTGNCGFLFEAAAYFAGFEVIQKQLEPVEASGYYS